MRRAANGERAYSLTHRRIKVVVVLPLGKVVGTKQIYAHSPTLSNGAFAGALCDGQYIRNCVKGRCEKSVSLQPFDLFKLMDGVEPGFVEKTELIPQ